MDQHKALKVQATDGQANIHNSRVYGMAKGGKRVIQKIVFTGTDINGNEIEETLIVPEIGETATSEHEFKTIKQWITFFTDENGKVHRKVEPPIWPIRVLRRIRNVKCKIYWFIRELFDKELREDK